MKVRFIKQIASGNKKFKQGEVYTIGDDVAKNYISKGFCVPYREVSDEFKHTEVQTKEDKPAVKAATEATKKPAAKRKTSKGKK